MEAISALEAKLGKKIEAEASIFKNPAYLALGVETAR